MPEPKRPTQDPIADVPRWFACLQSLLPTLTAVWLVSWAVVAVVKAVIWSKALGGYEALFRSYSLSSAGDFLAGVAAVPAFGWLIMAYFAQRAELIASVRELAEQANLMRIDLELRKTEQNMACDPEFAFELVYCGTDGELPASYAMAENAPHDFLLHIWNRGHRVTEVRVSLLQGPKNFPPPLPAEPVPALAKNERMTLRFTQVSCYPCTIVLGVHFLRANESSGIHRHVMSAAGEFSPDYRPIPSND